ncbi:hypothetical protein RN053_13275 [Pantoea dispersa]|uniref:hypothetical protein n=1 Tax=Pantoea dispersa TaxID=59814 RepID=UPI0028DF66FD|nr:hypothetical protein [Pantoea dispersa]MDT8851467.1 hypothetical protein [Pantoea dispersa]
MKNVIFSCDFIDNGGGNVTLGGDVYLQGELLIHHITAVAVILPVLAETVSQQLFHIHFPADEKMIYVVHFHAWLTERCSEYPEFAQGRAGYFNRQEGFLCAINRYDTRHRFFALSHRKEQPPPDA